MYPAFTASLLRQRRFSIRVYLSSIEFGLVILVLDWAVLALVLAAFDK